MDESARMTAYIVDDMYYVGTADSSGSMIWDSQSAPSSIWEQQEQTQQFMDLLEGSKVNSLKTEKVDGIPCYLVEIVPDLETLWKLVLGQSGDFTTDVDIDLLGGSLKKVNVKYWFDQDTMFFNKIYVYLDMELDEEQLGEEGEIRFITEMTMAFQEHNASVDITVPEEALTG
jgi:hypothetical protein